MAIVKDKIKLFETSLSDFSIEMVNGIPFYNRYPELQNIFKKHVPTVDFNQCFAQPNENKTTKVLEWFCFPFSGDAYRLADVETSDPQLYTTAKALVDQVVQAIKAGISNAEENDRMYLNAALKGIEGDDAKSTTYVCDGKILFGIWGMRKNSGRNLENVIRENVADHRVFSINYLIKEGGKLSFSSINRKHGYILSSKDVPTVEASQGWKFTKWSPEVPQGKKVTENLTFTAICERDNEAEENRIINEEKNKGGDGPQPPEEGTNSGSEDDPQEYTVTFKSENEGTLDGQTEYRKRDGEKVLHNEIPIPIPNEGYEFIGWDRQPQDHTVHQDTVFVARFRKKTDSKVPFWSWFWGWGSGCLNWLLALLLLGLIGLLLWYLLSGYRDFNFCGCDCTETVVVPQPDPNGPDSLVVVDEGNCDKVTESGDDKGIVKYVNMGQKSGSFLFEFDTYTAKDKITIYNGKKTQGTPIYQYSGGSQGVMYEQVHFNSPDGYISVVVQAIDSGTAWVFQVHCPQN